MSSIGKKIIKKIISEVNELDQSMMSVKSYLPDEPDDDDDEGFEIISAPDDDGIVAGSVSGDPNDEIQERQDDLEQLAGDFILGLCGLEEQLDIGDIMEPESLNDFIETVECLLWIEYGIDIYRPRTVKDKAGIEHVVCCMSEEEELK